jgi:putative aminopeptidase FrvX
VRGPDLAWLEELSALDGVSGAEAPVREAVWARLAPWVDEAWVDPLGCLVATRRWGAPGPRRALVAHLDEVGLAVTHVDPDGLLRLQPVGGVDPRVLPGARVRVGAAGVPGVVVRPPVHLAERERRGEAVPLDELRIDVGAQDAAEAERVVHPGDLAAFATEPGRLGRLFRGKALDDRAGVVAVVAAAEAAAAAGWDLPLAFVFTVQEEIGTRGAQAVAEALGVDEVVVVETTTAADLPEVPSPAVVARLGAGPAVTALDGAMVADRALAQGLVEVAVRRGLPVQWKEAATGATDAARFAALGAAAAAVSVPCRYLHAPVGALDPRDLEAAAELLVAWLEARARGGGPGWTTR